MREVSEQFSFGCGMDISWNYMKYVNFYVSNINISSHRLILIPTKKASWPTKVFQKVFVAPPNFN